MMGTKLFRRTFIRKSVLFFTGIVSFNAGSRKLKAEQKHGDNNSDETQAVNDTIRTINSLRTIHGNFTEQDIPDSKIQLILKSCIRAANASNMQTYSIIVVKDRDKMKKVCTYSGSCMLLFCVDYTRLKACAKSLGHTYYPDNTTNFITGSTNTILAAQTAVIAARSLGIDCLLTNGIHRGDMERVWKILDLPQNNCYPLIALVMGYPTEEPAFKKGRLDGAGIFHYGKYHHLTQGDIDEIVRKTDDKQSHIGLNGSWDEKGHKHYYDWFFTAWNADRKPKETETQHFRLLKRSSFVDLQKQ
jgi:nitroreductase